MVVCVSCDNVQRGPCNIPSVVCFVHIRDFQLHVAIVSVTCAGTDKRPIVEFALENTQALRKMAAKQAWQKTQQPGTVCMHLFFALLSLHFAQGLDHMLLRTAHVRAST